ncbi:MAG: NAD(P)/FAD-dependent oxidoreductase [Thermoplasmata archaeon]|nr:NAD(P)/FAD-dependent oxidoreductase [Thermoplasmata archaeon]
MERLDVAVIGAGVVGLAVADRLVRGGLTVGAVERADRPGTEQSTHNSGVVHAGFHPLPGTLRAILNVAGNPMLYSMARRVGAHTEHSGTLVVARNEGDVAELQKLEERARRNQVPHLESITPAQAREREPHLGPCVAGLWAPTGGRVDAAALVDGLARSFGKHGGVLRTGFEVASAAPGDAWTLTSTNGDQVEATWIVNAAGLRSADVAAMCGASGHRIYPCRGEYARVVGAKREWVRSMIYGIPAPGYPGAGIHLTRQVTGELLIGPTAAYVDGPEMPATPLAEFHREAATLLPGLELEDLTPGYIGIRAKTAPPGSPESIADYLIAEQPAGFRAIQMIGIESPGLTASGAVAQYVARQLARARPEWARAVSVAP